MKRGLHLMRKTFKFDKLLKTRICSEQLYAKLNFQKK